MKKENKSKLCSLLAGCLVMVLLLANMQSIGAKAAGYSGSGTKADPYLVQTAEQLQGIRDNLSAHYKLANTIDLSGVDFKPIGRLDAPFTGTFTCELNGDKTPKYIIKNLSVNVADTYSVDNYAKDKNKMEAALFGATKGATLSGIYVLDAKISNKNFGDNTGAIAYGDYKPGMDEMNSAILIGQADNTTVMNCGTTGIVDTRSNHCAGLIGIAKDSTIKNCYSTATVKSEGLWNIGGLIGAIENSTVSACCATGNVTGAQSNIAPFISSVSGSTIMDCYSTGNASGGKERKNSFAVVHDSQSATFKNCFALGSVDEATEIAKYTATATNCWVLSGKSHNTTQFTEGSLESIKSAFGGQTNWDVSGNQPQLTTFVIVTDSSKYVPGAVTTGTTSTTTGTTTGTTAGETTSATAGAATTSITPEEVAAMIQALPDKEAGEAITIEDKDAVKEAMEAYESLSTAQKDEFDIALSGKLMNLCYDLSLLIVSDLVKAVNELPVVEELTPEYVDEIMELWSDYEFLDDTVIEELDDDIIKKLEAAHEYALDIKENGATYVSVTDVFSNWQWIVLGVCAFLLFTALVFNVVIFVIALKKNKTKKKETTKMAANAE